MEFLKIYYFLILQKLTASCCFNGFESVGKSAFYTSLLPKYSFNTFFFLLYLENLRRHTTSARSSCGTGDPNNVTHKFAVLFVKISSERLRCSDTKFGPFSGLTSCRFLSMKRHCSARCVTVLKDKCQYL